MLPAFSRVRASKGKRYRDGGRDGEGQGKRDRDGGIYREREKRVSKEMNE